MPENYKCIMDNEYQEKKGNLLAEIFSLQNIYTLTKYFLSVNTNYKGKVFIFLFYIRAKAWFYFFLPFLPC
jgi:hypothetical protein